MIVAGYKVINEADFLYQSIASIYKWVDRIIIFESCYKHMQKVALPGRLTPEGLSTDGTTEIIKSFPDPDKKIEYYPIGFVEDKEWDLRTRLVEMIDVDDYMWLMDGDEVYSDELSGILYTWIVSGKYDAIWLPSMIFWHDMIHIRNGHGWELSHQRIYRKICDSFHYAPHNLTVRWTDAHGNIYGYGMPPKSTHYRGREYKVFVGQMSDLWYYHYAYVRSPQRILEKSLMQFIQNVYNKRDAFPDEWRHFQQYDSVLEFKLQTYPWFTNHDANEICYTGVAHPSYMEGHSAFKRIWDDQPIRMSLSDAMRLVKPCRKEDLK